MMGDRRRDEGKDEEGMKKMKEMKREEMSRVSCNDEREFKSFLINVSIIFYLSSIITTIIIVDFMKII